MSGKSSVNLNTLFELQKAFQLKITGAEALPVDDTKWFSYHMQAMMEELGEVLKADKRWKTHRNAHFDRSNKIDELADVFITWMNMALFSNVSPEEMQFAIIHKIWENKQKFEKGCQDGDSNSRRN